jgi:phosphatidylglycerophosphate synthase
MSIATAGLSTPGRFWDWCKRNNHLWIVQQIPNILTLSRVFAPYTFYLSYSSYAYDGNTQAAIGWLILTGALAATDWLDGKAARALDHVSKFGKLLDPVMDKITSLTGLFFYLKLVDQSGSPTVIFAALFTMALLTLGLELSLVTVAIGGVIWIRRHDQLGLNVDEAEGKIGANRWGKRKFSAQAASLSLGYFTIYLAGPARNWVSPLICTVGLVIAFYYGCLSLSQHIRDARNVTGHEA